jgi:hypothetical protein
MIRLLNIALSAIILSVPLTAQMRGGYGHGGVGRNGQHHSRRRGVYPGLPFFSSDYDGPTSEAADDGPPMLIVRPDDSDSRISKTTPLLIEWRGDRYVRIGGAKEDREQRASERDYSESTIANTRTPAPNPPAVLVYRDGHREEISEYAIADGMMYVGDDYWQTGGRRKPIPLAALDPQATVRSNQDRGIRFMFPSAPNVVVASF